MQQNSLMFYQPSDALPPPVNPIRDYRGLLSNLENKDSFNQSVYSLPYTTRLDFLPLGKNERGIGLAVPQALLDMYNATIPTVGKALSGQLGVPSINNPVFTGAVTDMGANIAGGGLIGSRFPNAVPENALGIFAGKKATNFPAKSMLQQPDKKLLQLNNELDVIRQELTKGRFALGDETTNQLRNRKIELLDAIVDEYKLLDKKKSEETLKLDEFMQKQDLRSGIKDDVSRFRGSEREFGTGLFQLPDNQYRFEIDDRPAKIKLDIKDDADALYTTITSDAFERVLPRTDMGITKQLDEFLDHDELFKAYPQLRKYPVKIKFDVNDTARGSFNPATNQITINLADMRPFLEGTSVTGKSLKKEIKSTLMHEIQHAVQEIEGFARGSNPSVSNFDDAVLTATKQRLDIIQKNQDGYNAYNASRADLINLGRAERIKYYEIKSMLDNHQPRLLFNQGNWYKYGSDISREVSQELGYAYKKRKSPEREKWISLAFAKLAEKERFESPVSARLADNLSLKEIKSRYGKAERINDKNYKSFAEYRNARLGLDQIEKSYRYSSANPERSMNIYRDSLGEVEARAVQARAEPTITNKFPRSYFPPQQFQEGGMDYPPPFGLSNTLRQTGGLFEDL